MNSTIKKLAFCAFLGASGSALASPVLIPYGDFEDGGANWRFDQANGHSVSYPTIGGISGIFAQINGSSATAAGFAVLVNPASTVAPADFISLSSLSLTAGQSYVFSQAMKIFAGNNIGGFKLEWREGSGTGEIFLPKIGTGSTWETYNFTIPIPAGVTGIKFVPLWGANSIVGYDNITVSALPAPPAPLPPQASIAPATKVNWTPVSLVNSYQPQKSVDNIVYKNIGPANVGTAVSSVFDAGKAPFYRVMESLPGTQNPVYNGGFTKDEFLTPNRAEGWQSLQLQAPSRLLTGGRGDDGPCMQIQVLDIPGADGSEIQQNTKNAHFVATGNAVPGTVTPGQTYNFEFWAKQISSSGAYEQRFKVSFLADGGAIVTDGIFQPFNPAVGGDWTRFFLNDLVVPEGATSALIQILGVPGSDDGDFGEVLIDDVSLSGPGTGLPTLFVATTAPAVGISWPSTTGKSVQVQSSLSLAGWTNFGAVVPGDNTLKTVFDPIVDPKKFYRVGELP